MLMENARREEEALAVFKEMLNAGISLCKNDSGGQIGSALQASLYNNNVHLYYLLRRPTQKAYNILLYAFAISGMVEQGQTVFKSMRRDRCTPDLCSYTTMLSAYVNASDMDGAKKFFRRLKQDGLSPNEVTYGALIKGYAKVNDLEKMMEKDEEMGSSGIRANQTVLTTIMDVYGKNKDLGSALIWFKESESSGVTEKKPRTSPARCNQ